MHDVVVVGGGPSGSWAAHLLSKRGFDVLLLERGGRNRYKVCSGGTPLRTLMLLGFHVPRRILQRRVMEVNIYGPGGARISASLGRTLGYLVDRVEFDQWLRDEAQASGAEVVYNVSAHGFRFNGEYVEVKAVERGLERTFRGRFMIGAFGANPTLLRRLGLEPPDYMVSVQLEMEGDEEVIDGQIGDTLNFFVDSRFSSSSYGWVFPKRSYVSVGLTERPGVPGLHEKLFRFVGEHPVASKLLSGLRVRSLPGGREFLAHLNPNNVVGKTYGDRFVLVGDAAGFSDPVTWEGIYYALSSATVAADVYEELYERGDFSARATRVYQARWMSLYSHFGYERLVRELLWSGDVDRRWSYIISHFNSREDLRRLLNWGLAVHMSIAPVISRLSFLEKFRIGWALGGSKFIREPEKWEAMLRVLFEGGQRYPIEVEAERAFAIGDK